MTTNTDKELLEVKEAECCCHCANTSCDFTFRDAVMCHLTNKYQSHTDVCQRFKRKEK